MSSKPKILLVDDRRDNLMALEAQLRAHDAEFLCAESGERALDLLLEHEVALALLDVQMSVMDGLELAEIMRSSSRTRGIPIIFVTAGLHDRSRVFKGYEAGAVDFLIKPIDPWVLRNKVAVFLTLYEQRRQLAERIGELEAAKDALRASEAQLLEADRRKNDFIATLSHELRNPLAPIKNCLYILDHAAPGGAQARRAKATIDRQVNQLGRLVDDLLDITRITRNKFQLQRQQLELNDLIRRTLEDHRSEFEKAGVRLDLEAAPAPVWVHADWTRLAQTLGNLVQNAVKFTPRDGRVIVSVSADLLREQALIRVADTGVGMKPETLAGLFEPFMQAEVTLERSKGGLGLGLALVKGIVELHGGAIEAKSEGLGHGTEFLVRLPLELTGIPP
jgi:signal transduction histidine kinase